MGVARWTYPLQAQPGMRAHGGNIEPQKLHRHTECGSVPVGVDPEGASLECGVDLVDSNILS
jgi:hypothetical protein